MKTALQESTVNSYTVAAEEINTKLKAEMASQSAQAREHFLATINADLPAVQEVLKEHVEQMLAVAMPKLEQDLRGELTAELQALLLKVKFVLP